MDIFLDVGAQDMVLKCLPGSLLDHGTGTKIIPCGDVTSRQYGDEVHSPQ
jgi:hypothetical protein